MLSRLALIQFCVLAGLLAAPAIEHLLGPGEAAQHENRRLAAAPGLPANKADFKAFPGRLDLYLSDHFGFRQLFIEKVDQVRFYVLGQSTSPQVTLGRDGMLFFNSHDASRPNELIAYTCDHSGAAEDAAGIAEAVTRIAQAYGERGIEASFVLVPNASRIYADLLSRALPPELLRECLSATPDRYARAAAALAEQGIVYIYPLAEFRRWRADYDVYPRRFYHWAGETPWRTAGLLFARLGHALPDDVPRLTRAETSDLRGLMGGFHLNSDVYGPDPKKRGSTICIEPSCMDPRIYALTQKGYQVSVTRAEDAPLGRAILVSDSFGGAVTPGLARGHRELIHLYPVAPPEGDEPHFYKTVIPLFAPERVIFVHSDYRIDRIYRKIADALDAGPAAQNVTDRALGN